MHAHVPIPGLPWPSPIRHIEPRLESQARLVSSSERWLYSARLEKRSQALQACNLTRNIQADGAPMVHRPLESKSPGVFFCPHRTPESMP
jgi:hypothetical protein